jgi:hypothetical protein
MSEESNEPKLADEPAVLPENKSEGSSVKNAKTFQRASSWKSSLAAIKLSMLPREKFRTGDKITEYLTALSLATLAFLVFAPTQTFKPQLALLCDALFVTTIVCFIAGRLGVLNNISQRFAVLVWDVILGFFLLGVVLTVNMVVLLIQLRQISGQF